MVVPTHPSSVPPVAPQSEASGPPGVNLLEAVRQAAAKPQPGPAPAGVGLPSLPGSLPPIPKSASSEPDERPSVSPADDLFPEIAGVLKVDEKALDRRLGHMIRDTVEKTLNDFLDAEARDLCGAERHERSEDRKGYRSGSYERTFLTKAGEVTLKMPKVKGVGNKYEALRFDSQIIARYRRREISIEEALVEMYYAGVSVRRVEDITEALWGVKVGPQTVSDLNQKVAKNIEDWRNQPIPGTHAYVYMDGIWLKRTWGHEVKNVPVLIAVGVDEEGHREILGVMEGAKEDHASWNKFVGHLKDRGLKGVRLVVSDKCMGLVEAVASHYPDADWQWCTVHWKRNLMSHVPHSKLKEVMLMAKAVHMQEDAEAALQKAEQVAKKLDEMKLKEAAKFVRNSTRETLTFLGYPSEHWRKLHSNNLVERLNKEIRRRTRVVGSFPDSDSALILVGARCRYVASKSWGGKRYMDMGRLHEMDRERESERQRKEAEALEAHANNASSASGKEACVA